MYPPTPIPHTYTAVRGKASFMTNTAINDSFLSHSSLPPPYAKHCQWIFDTESLDTRGLIKSSILLKLAKLKTSYSPIARDLNGAVYKCFRASWLLLCAQRETSVSFLIYGRNTTNQQTPRMKVLPVASRSRLTVSKFCMMSWKDGCILNCSKSSLL